MLNFQESFDHRSIVENRGSKSKNDEFQREIEVGKSKGYELMTSLSIVSFDLMFHSFLGWIVMLTGNVSSYLQNQQMFHFGLSSNTHIVSDDNGLLPIPHAIMPSYTKDLALAPCWVT